MAQLQCAVLACRATIEPGEQYYALGGGAVPTCTKCAEEAPFTIVVNKKPVPLARAWHRAACAKQLLRRNGTEVSK